ncbi:MAG: ABC transporter substrate-binding protein [Proteobacteria bacterium]|nr:ABC transporter substrate-binding protein [Pseudomonadota bacterium]MBU1715475.1 ABC transporter substrate-binding protein [Pseudomonadota bacterium]
MNRGAILTRVGRLLTVGLVATVLLSGLATAQNMVAGDELVIGMSNAQSGPASALGQGLKQGAMVYFDKVNKAGGIHGRKIRMISYDDGYEPRNTVKNTQKLISEDKVFALFGYVGTPTSKAILPLISQEQIIYFSPFTGAEFLRNPVNRYVFNIRSSYFDEAEAQIEYLTTVAGIKGIGLFIQDDAYGLAVKGGIMRALQKREMDLIGEGRYTRNTLDVSAGLNDLKKVNPKAISMVGTYKAMATFIKEAKATGYNPSFFNVSFVGTDALIQELDGKGDGTLVTQVMPSPDDSGQQIVKQYRQDMGAAKESDLNYVSLEGYIDAVVFVEILKKAGRDLTTDSFISAAEALNYKAGDIWFSFSRDNHQALQKVYITKVAGGKAVSVH